MDNEEDKEEEIKKENIKKLDEAYQKSKTIPEDYKKKIRKRIVKNSILAILVISYLFLINVLSLYIETETYLIIIKVICVILALISVVYFELSYRKDSGYLFLNGAEFLVIATITLFSVYAYSLFYVTYNNILFGIAIVVTVYYIIKTILTVRNMKKQYYDSQNDIREIIKKGNTSND